MGEDNVCTDSPSSSYAACSDGTFEIPFNSKPLKCWIDCTGLLQCFDDAGNTVWEAFDGGDVGDDGPYVYDFDGDDTGCVSLGKGLVEPLLVSVVPV